MSSYISYRDGGKTTEEGLFKWLSRLFTKGNPTTYSSTSMAVSQRGAGANMSVDIAVGDVHIPYSTYSFYGWIDAIENKTVTAADGTNPRRDIVVAYADLSVVSDATDNNTGALKFAVVAGTPAGSPSDPNDAAIDSAVSNNPWVKLARIQIPAGATTVVDAYITDLRTPIAFRGRLWGGSSNTSGHTIPNAADDTVALLAATQTFTNKTFDNPTIKNSTGWNDLDQSVSVSSGYNKGNKEFDLTFSATMANILSPGMKLKLTRGTTAPTQCADLESGSSHYASRASGSVTGFSQTDDVTFEAWINLESFPSGDAPILSRFNGTSGINFVINANGQVRLTGYNAGVANYRRTESYQAIPLGRWVHVAATLDMSTYSDATCAIYIDGVSVPILRSTSGTNPTAFVQAGALELGRRDSGTEYLDGKLSDVRYWSAVRTATQIRDNMNQQLVGNETNLVAYYKLNGNFNDSTSNANDLTAQNSAAATNADNPMNDTEYAVVTKVATTTVTVFTGTDHNIPNMTLNSPQYSTQRAPFGFPCSENKWLVDITQIYQQTVNLGSTDTWTTTNLKLSVPTGDFIVGYSGAFQFNSSVAGTRDGHVTLSSTTPTNNLRSQDLTSIIYDVDANNAIDTIYRESPVSQTSQTEWTLYAEINTSTGTEIFYVRGDRGMVKIFAKCAYI